jgi:hypothetical protein
MSKADPYLMLVVTGRTKGKQLAGARFAVLCVGKTDGMGLQTGEWVTRLVGSMKKVGIITGRLFQKRLDPPRLFEMTDDVMTMLEQVKSSCCPGTPKA